MSEENKRVELNDEELEKVGGGTYIDNEGHVFAFAPGFNFAVRTGAGKVYKVEECYVEDGVNKYKLGSYILQRMHGYVRDGYVYWTEGELADTVGIGSR